MPRQSNVAPKQPDQSLPIVGNTYAGFRAVFFYMHKREPNAQEIWNHGVRSGLQRQANNVWPWPVGEPEV